MQILMTMISSMLKFRSLHSSLVAILFIVYAPEAFAQQDLYLSQENETKQLIPQSPFVCGSEFYFTIGPGELSVLDPGNPGGGLQLLFPLPENVNATGYNPIDNYIYAIGKGSLDGHPLRIHSDGTVEDLGDIGLPLTPVTGGFAPDGLWYVKEGNTQEIAIIDLNTLTFTLTDPGSLFDGKDWAYHYVKDKFYGVHQDILYSYDPAANVVESFSVSGFLPENGVTCGAAFYSDDGFIYVLNNKSGYLYRIDVDTQQAYFIHAGPTDLTSVDGCACPYSPPPFPVVYAEPDSFCLDINGTQSYFIHDNDEVNIANLDFNTFSVILPPMYGTIDYNSSTGEITYTANGTPQADSLIYEICCDGPAVTCDQATIYIDITEIASFDPFGPYCTGDIPDDLPTTSNESISGDWFPSFISTDSPGTYDFNFTPDPLIHACALPTTITIEIEPTEIPSFVVPGPYCTGDIPDILPDYSLEGISGEWYPPVIDTDTPGDQVYTFLPDPTLHPCGEVYNFMLTVLDKIQPSFSLPITLCQYDSAPDLPETSLEGVTGTWEPAVVSTDVNGTFSYTFTPDPVQYPCTDPVEVTIDIDQTIQPAFDTFGPFCQFDAVPSLPVVANNGIIGSWSPDTILSDIPGNQQFIFTPDPVLHPCVPADTMEILISNHIQASFSMVTEFCQSESPELLPGTSLEGISGSWSPAVISTDQAGTNYYTFTPEPALYPCSTPTLTEVVVHPKIAIEVVDQSCADDLGSYSLEILVSGGTAPLMVETANGYSITYLGGSSYLIVSIPSGEGVDIMVTDEMNCTAALPSPPHYCDCPEIDPPAGTTNASYCFGESPSTALEVEDPGMGYQIQWYSEDSILLSSGNTFLPDSAGVYYAAILELVNQCTSEWVAVELIENPALIIEGYSGICAGSTEPYEIELSISGGTPDYNIDAGGLDTDQTDPNTFIINNVTDTDGWTIEVMDAFGCTASTFVQPHILPLPEVEAGPDQVIDCFDGIAILQGYTDNPANSAITWTSTVPGYTSSSLNPQVDASGMYFLSVKDRLTGCWTTDSLTVSDPEYPSFDFAVEPILCYGDQNGEIAFTALEGGLEPYLFSIDDGENFYLDTSFNALSPGVYTLVLQDALGCESTAQINLEEPEPIEIFLDAEWLIQFGDDLQLDVETNLDEDAIGTIIWTPADGLDCVDCLEPSATPYTDTEYTIMLMDTSGCSQKATVLIRVDENKEIFIPNVFSPNGDQINDYFYIQSENNIERIEVLRVFHRWGHLVFETFNQLPNDQHAGWDGRFNEQLLAPEVFTYYAKIRLRNGSKLVVYGDVTLIR
jgi:gliding motility-associated-like protein